MKLKKLINYQRLQAAILVLGLSSCSHANVQSEWDCPKQQGYGCINIEKADSNAVNKIIVNTEVSKPLSLYSTYINDGKEYEVWFSEFVDADQNVHEVSKVRYKQ